MADIVRPYEPLPPTHVGLLADRLTQVMPRLQSLGIAVNPSSRLPEAVKVLRQVQASERYPTDEPSLIRIANAIKIAFNFVRIIDAIRPPPPPGVAYSLRRALDGSLDDTGPTPAHQAQSELFFGAALVASGLSTGAPKPATGKSPDYVVEVSTFRYSSEVKRPGSIAVIEGCISDAVHQLREYNDSYPAQLVLDLSDVLPVTFGVTDLQAAQSANRAAFREGYTSASAYISRRRRDEGYSRIGGLFCFAESLLWTAPAAPLPHSNLFVFGEVFHEAVAGLVVEASQHLRRAIVRGFQEVGGAGTQLRRVP